MLRPLGDHLFTFAVISDSPGELLFETVHELRNPLVSFKTFVELSPERASDPEFQNELRQNIVLAGGGSQIRGVAEEVRSNLTEFGTCRVSAVEDLVYAGANGALSLAMDMPESEWRRHSTSG